MLSLRFIAPIRRAYRPYWRGTWRRTLSDQSCRQTGRRNASVALPLLRNSRTIGEKRDCAGKRVDILRQKLQVDCLIAVVLCVIVGVAIESRISEKHRWILIADERQMVRAGDAIIGSRLYHCMRGAAGVAIEDASTEIDLRGE